MEINGDKWGSMRLNWDIRGLIILISYLNALLRINLYLTPLIPINLPDDVKCCLTTTASIKTPLHS